MHFNSGPRKILFFHFLFEYFAADAVFFSRLCWWALKLFSDFLKKFSKLPTRNQSVVTTKWSNTTFLSLSLSLASPLISEKEMWNSFISFLFFQKKFHLRKTRKRSEPTPFRQEMDDGWLWENYFSRGPVVVVQKKKKKAKQQNRILLISFLCRCVCALSQFDWRYRASWRFFSISFKLIYGWISYLPVAAPPPALINNRLIHTHSYTKGWLKKKRRRKHYANDGRVRMWNAVTSCQPARERAPLFSLSLNKSFLPFFFIFR